MAITSSMAKMTVRSTFALDPETVEALDRLAGCWGVSNSEVLSRVIGIASKIADVDAASAASSGAGRGEGGRVGQADPRRALGGPLSWIPAGTFISIPAS
jgi:hypothetical protein